MGLDKFARRNVFESPRFSPISREAHRSVSLDSWHLPVDRSQVAHCKPKIVYEFFSNGDSISGWR